MVVPRVGAHPARQAKEAQGCGSWDFTHTTQWICGCCKGGSCRNLPLESGLGHTEPFVNICEGPSSVVLQIHLSCSPHPFPIHLPVKERPKCKLPAGAAPPLDHSRFGQSPAALLQPQQPPGSDLSHNPTAPPGTARDPGGSASNQPFPNPTRK